MPPIEKVIRRVSIDLLDMYHTQRHILLYQLMANALLFLNLLISLLKD